MTARRHLVAAELDAFILERYGRNVALSDIANDTGNSVATIIERLAANGVEVEGKDQPSVHPMWSAGEYTRRFAIWKKQRDGVAALKARWK